MLNHSIVVVVICERGHKKGVGEVQKLYHYCLPLCVYACVSYVIEIELSHLHNREMMEMNAAIVFI